MAKIQSLASVMNDSEAIGISLDGAAYGLHLNNNQAGIYFCTGTPEAQISAHIGSLAMQVDGAADNQLFVKETGAGTNTGWVAQAT